MFGFGSAGVDAAELRALLGLMPNTPVAQAALTPVFDLAALSSGVVVAIPTFPGFLPIVEVFGNLVATAGTGVCTVGPTLSVGNNANEDNLYLASAVTVAQVNASIAAGFPSKLNTINGAQGTNTRLLLDLSTQATVKVTVAAVGTGGFTLQGFLEFLFVLRAV